METTKISPLDYAISLPVSPRAQLAWLYAVQFYGRHKMFPNPAQIADGLDISESQARRVVMELISVGELHRQAPGVIHMLEAV